VGFAIAHAITLLNGRLSGGLRHMNFSRYPGAKGRDFFSLERSMRLEVPECFRSRWDDAMAQS
jgi:hypothetical protein